MVLTTLIGVSSFALAKQEHLPMLSKSVNSLSVDILLDLELNRWIDKLGTYENCGEKILDSNHRYSYGILCFQEATFKGYVKKYNLLPEAEDNEIMNFISDDEFQKKLARTMIREDCKNLNHWFTSVFKRKGLDKPLICK